MGWRQTDLTVNHLFACMRMQSGALKKVEVARNFDVAKGTVTKWLKEFGDDFMIDAVDERIKRERSAKYPLLNERILAYVNITEVNFQHTGIGSSWESVRGMYLKSVKVVVLGRSLQSCSQAWMTPSCVTPTLFSPPRSQRLRNQGGIDEGTSRIRGCTAFQWLVGSFQGA